jgi:polyphosphate kinase 2 (PPK2 family)
MLHSIDLNRSLDPDEYKRRLKDGQVRLRESAHQLYLQKRTLVMVVEGWDAAGKGGVIRRLTHMIDPRGYKVYSIGPPEGEDRTHHYLWRFWRRLSPPEDKQVLIFDRSWYGRVLVERVEGFAEEPEWKRAYREINEFERQLTNHGTLLTKFWFEISPEEQLERFRAREQTPHKRWKLTEEDWRNRGRWQDYQEAVAEMLLKTSTASAPWTVVEGNDKLWERVKTLETINDVLEAALGRSTERTASPANDKAAKKRRKKSR